MFANLLHGSNIYTVIPPRPRQQCALILLKNMIIMFEPNNVCMSNLRLSDSNSFFKSLKYYCLQCSKSGNCSELHDDVNDSL